jgi:transposase
MAAKPTPEKTLLKTLQTLRRYDGNQIKTAETLGVSRSTVQDHIRQAMRRSIALPQSKKNPNHHRARLQSRMRRKSLPLPEPSG